MLGNKSQGNPKKGWSLHTRIWPTARQKHKLQFLWILHCHVHLLEATPPSVCCIKDAKLPVSDICSPHKFSQLSDILFYLTDYPIKQISKNQPRDCGKCQWAKAPNLSPPKRNALKRWANRPTDQGLDPSMEITLVPPSQRPIPEESPGSTTWWSCWDPARRKIIMANGIFDRKMMIDQWVLGKIQSNGSNGFEQTFYWKESRGQHAVSAKKSVIHSPLPCSGNQCPACSPK